MIFALIISFLAFRRQPLKVGFPLIALAGNLYPEDATCIDYPQISLEYENVSLQNQSQWDFFADMLLLRADQIATWALNTQFRPFTTSGGVNAVNFTNSPKMLQFNWDFGVRTGLGYYFERDHWDTQLFYTWFHTKGKDDTIAGNSFSNISSAFLGEWLTFGFNSNSGHIQWNIVLNAIDWEIGRDTQVKGLSFRPHLGIKGGWIHQTVHSHWSTSPNYTAIENLKNDFWGLGPKGGVNSKWDLAAICNHSFHLFGDASVALLGGCWILKDIQNTSMNSSITSITHPTTWAGTFMFHALMGFGWDLKLNQSNFGARVGYELQYWFDQLKIFTFLEGTLHAALVLQGGMLDVHFDY